MSDAVGAGSDGTMPLDPDLEALLLPHQKEGVRWMLSRETDKRRSVLRCGVLADDMGLGKTVQSAALFKAREVPTLVVTTTSTVGQWMEEVRRVTGRHALPVSSQCSTELPPVSTGRQVFVTTYDTITGAYERARVDKSREREATKRSRATADRRSVASERPGSRSTFHPVPAPGCSLIDRTWGRIVLDEAHLIRNQKTARFRSVMQLGANATHRWALTGTPINNRIEDLAALSEWVGIQLVGNPRNQAFYILRRTMEEVVSRVAAPTPASVPAPSVPESAALESVPECTPSTRSGGDARAPSSSEPIVAAPSLVTRIERIPFLHAAEKELYKRLEDLSAFRQQQATGDGGAGPEPGDRKQGHEASATLLRQHAVGRTSNRAMEEMLRMRQACVSPSIYAEGIHKRLGRGSSYSALGPDERACLELATEHAPRESSKIAHVADSVASACAADPSVKVIVFFEWLSEMELLDAALKKRRDGAACCRFHGAMSVMERTGTLAMFNDRGAEPRVILVQIRTGGVGLNLQVASLVYVTSPSWNPCNELQAMSRAYRFGQSRTVTCVRVVMADTIEDGCVDMQRRKLQRLDELLSCATSSFGITNAVEQQHRQPKRQRTEMSERMGFVVGEKQ